ncbi:MAG: bifunctional diguanylate cyclase/phosphodiesterase [Cystobacter sp.]
MMLRRSLHLEPAIRAIVAGLTLLCAVWLYVGEDRSWAFGGMLLVCGLNLPGAARFCRLERLLRAWGLRSEAEALRVTTCAQARAEYLETLDLLREVVLELAVDGSLVRASERWAELFGVQAPASRPFRLIDQVSEEDQASLTMLLDALLKGELELLNTRFRTASPGGRTRWLEGKFVLNRQEGVLQGIRGVLSDVTDSYLQEQRIFHMEMHDALTGLPNRARLESWVAEALGQARERGLKVGLLFLDLDHFKQINDIHGHRLGDELLLAVGHQLGGCLRDGGLLARWGGDEFVVLLPGLTHAELVREVGERLRQAVRRLRPAVRPDLRITASLGGAVFPEDAVDAETLFIQADKALDFAKSQGRDNTQLHGDMRSQARALRDFELCSRLAQAVRQAQIEVHYQPVVDARSGAVVGVEALARWKDEKYGQVGPDVFIPMAEELGLISELGEVMMERSLAWFSQRAGRDDLRLSINVSNRQQVTSDFAGSLLERVRRHGIRPDQVKLEITESVAVEGVSAASRCLKELSAQGFLLSIDDFGTGFSSLSQLHTLPVDELKIDRSFVRRLRTREGRAIVKAIVDMAHDLGLVLVAEGVEDAETAELLRGLGVEMLQGYYFSRPLPPEECERFLGPVRSLACAM